MNLPNVRSNRSPDGIREKLNVFDFLFDDKDDVANSRPFSYYIYSGSNTSPPCAENVLYIIAEDI